VTVPFQWANAELGRVYVAAYQGRRARLCLAINPGTLTRNSTTAQWDAAEIAGQAGEGYARVEWTIPAGAYSNTTADFRSPVQLATFLADADGLGLQWDSVYLVLGTLSGGVTTWDTNIAGYYPEAPTIALSPSQPRSYNVQLITDDIITISG